MICFDNSWSKYPWRGLRRHPPGSLWRGGMFFNHFENIHVSTSSTTNTKTRNIHFQKSVQSTVSKNHHQIRNASDHLTSAASQSPTMHKTLHQQNIKLLRLWCSTSVTQPPALCALSRFLSHTVCLIKNTQPRYLHCAKSWAALLALFTIRHIICNMRTIE